MLIPYKQWLLAKQRRNQRLLGSWDRDMRPAPGTDCMDLHDVVHSPQFQARFADLIGMGKESNPATAPIRGKAVPCVYVDNGDNGHMPIGED